MNMRTKELRIIVYEFDVVIELPDSDRDLVLAARAASEGAAAAMHKCKIPTKKRFGILLLQNSCWFNDCNLCKQHQILIKFSNFRESTRSKCVDHSKC